MMFTAMLPVLLMLVGLAIDRTRLFIVEAKLSAAVDGAALGAGRLLGTSANIEEIAGEFLAANFRTGYWGSGTVAKDIHLTTVLATHTITVNASVPVPALFMRIIGNYSNTVYASAVATRRDSRVILVLDRSASMNGSMSQMITGATGFANMFTSGTDELGLVVFGSTAIVAYPTTRPYDSSPTGSGGPDTSFLTANPSLTDEIGNINNVGDTNSPEALSLAYIEIRKAHARDLAAIGTDDRLNSIVFFTDGQPTALSVYLNAPTTPPGNVISSSSTCTNKTATSTASTQMIGGIGVLNFATGSSLNTALYQLAPYNSTSVDTWLGYTSSSNYNKGDMLNLATGPNAGCTSYLDNSGLSGTNNDLTPATKIPAYDLYNNSTDDAAYTYSYIYGKYSNAYNNTDLTSGYSTAIAAWNATDNVGKTIRTQTAMKPISIYTIGYVHTTDGVDTALLKRLANTQDAPGYDSTQPTGMYVEVDTSTDLTAAFAAVASALLRLAK